MKYTDGLFSFPVRVYDGFSIRRAQKREEDLKMPVDGEWVEGRARIPYSEIKGMIDYFSIGRSPEDVVREGFDCCIVMTNSFGDFICNMPQSKLEKELNIFADRYEEIVEKMVNEEMEKKVIHTQSQPKKKSWWKNIFA